MSPPAFDSASWCRALTLSERAKLLTSLSRPSTAREPHEQVEHRSRAWRGQAPFGEGEWLRRRLALEGLDDASFARLIETSPQSLASLHSVAPAWLRELQAAYSEPAGEEIPLPVGPSEGKRPMIGFLRLLLPLLSRARQRMREGFGRIASEGKAPFPDPERTEAMLFASVPFRLIWMLDRTLVLELNVARLQGSLEGDTPEQRFDSFVKRLKRADIALPLLAEYPVLARQAEIGRAHV